MTENVSTLSFLNRVGQVLPQLHPAEKRLAQFMLDFPGDLASYSALELARLSNVSTATVSRFIRRLDYENYDAARRHVRADKQPPALTAQAPEQVKQALPDELVKVQDNIYRSAAGLNQTDLSEMVQGMAQARKLWVMGAGSQHWVAQYFQAQAARIKENTSLLAEDSVQLAAQLAFMQATDMVVVFAAGNPSAGAPAVEAQVSRLCLPALYITDDKYHVSVEPSWHLRCACEQSHGIDDVMPALSFAYLLLSRLGAC